MHRPHRPHRRRFLLLAAAALFISILPARPAPAQDGLLVYVGTYTDKAGKSKGIYTTRLDPATGALSKPEVAAEIQNPSFLVIHPTNRYLYAIGELDNFQGKKGGAVSAFSIDANTGKLTLINQQSSGGPGPCFVATDHTGKVALVANYGGGSIESLPINSDDGSLGPPATFIQHTGSGPDKNRQKEPHAHSLNPTPDNRFAIAADLGLDKLLIYKLDTARATLTPNDPPFASTPPAGGPRHLAFHPNGKYAYVCSEMGLLVTAFKYDGEKGTFSEINTTGTIPGDEKSPKYSTAECQVHPSGKFVYVSNRGHDSISAFKVEETTGALTFASNTKSGGKTPRNFRIDPTGQYLLAANQSTDNIASFKIDQSTGALTPTGHTAEVGAPVCLKFFPVGK